MIFFRSKCYEEVANLLRGRRACRTCYEDAMRVLRGSYEETAPVEFSLCGSDYKSTDKCLLDDDKLSLIHI